MLFDEVLSTRPTNPLAFLNGVRAFLTCADENYIEPKILEHPVPLGLSALVEGMWNLKGEIRCTADLWENRMVHG